MAEYIDREKVKTLLERYGAEEDAMKLLDGIQAADVAPMVHAHWIPRLDERGRTYGWNCSAPDCGAMSFCKGNYCPQCGAKMDGEEKS